MNPYFGFLDQKERTVFERIRNWWLNGGSEVAIRLYSGSGDPENTITAPVGSLWLRRDGGTGTTLYVKESGSGNTGWVAK